MVRANHFFTLSLSRLGRPTAFLFPFHRTILTHIISPTTTTSPVVAVSAQKPNIIK